MIVEFAVLSTVVLGVFVLYSVVETFVPASSQRRLNGSLRALLFVLAGLYTLYFPIEILDGVITDVRGAVLVGATLFGGWAVGLATALAMIAARIEIGGAGAFAGVAGIALEYVVLLALLLATGCIRRPCSHMVPLIVAAVAVAIIEAGSLLLIAPWELGRELFATNGPALGLLQFSAAITLGLLLKFYEERARILGDLQQRNAEIEYQAKHDALTGLGNRRLFHEQLEQAIKTAPGNAGKLAVLMLDLDQFRGVNDQLGHSFGDYLLQSVAKRLNASVQQQLGGRGAIMRLGGDEFAVFAQHLSHATQVEHIARRLLQDVRIPMRLAGEDLHLTASIGIAVYPEHGKSVETLLQNADAAMFVAKNMGRNTFEIYSEQITLEARERLALAGELRRALEEDELVLFFQPQVDLRCGSIIGVEALARWPHPSKGLVPPARFIPVAEEFGLIDTLGDWVLDAACKQARAWLDEGLAFGRMAINISGLQLLRGDFSARLEQAMGACGLPARYLELEITETVLMDRMDMVSKLLATLRARGISISIDDFGTGYSSLARLRDLPADRLKLDRSFVCNLPYDASDVALARSLVAMGNIMQFIVLAEGVETREQRDFLLRTGCAEAQGFWFSEPLPADQLRPLLQHTKAPNPA